jgi:hypothetical protein
MISVAHSSFAMRESTDSLLFEGAGRFSDIRKLRSKGGERELALIRKTVAPKDEWAEHQVRVLLREGCETLERYCATLESVGVRVAPVVRLSPSSCTLWFDQIYVDGMSPADLLAERLPRSGFFDRELQRVFGAIVEMVFSAQNGHVAIDTSLDNFVIDAHGPVLVDVMPPLMQDLMPRGASPTQKALWELSFDIETQLASLIDAWIYARGVSGRDRHLYRAGLASCALAVSTSAQRKGLTLPKLSDVLSGSLRESASLSRPLRRLRQTVRFAHGEISPAQYAVRHRRLSIMRLIERASMELSADLSESHSGGFDFLSTTANGPRNSGTSVGSSFRSKRSGNGTVQR